MIFYNGFNLLVDLILGLAVWFITRKISWWDGYHAATEDSIKWYQDQQAINDKYTNDNRD